MPIVDFNKTKLHKKVTDTIYAFEDDDSYFINSTSIGIEITFFNEKIESISIDPNYENFSLQSLKITRHTSLLDILKKYNKNKINWKFNCRNKNNECEIVTLNPHTSIFTFEKDEFWMSKIVFISVLCLNIRY